MPSRSDVERTLDMSSSGVREKFTPIKEDFWGVIQRCGMVMETHRRMSQWRKTMMRCTAKGRNE